MRNHVRPAAAGLLAATLAAVALLLVPASPAAAHNSLQAATPARDGQLATAPKHITLQFMQKLDPAFITIALSDATQRKLPTGEPTVSGTKGTVTIDKPLANGTYTVAYRVVSADGHPVQGSYRFTLADPTATASPEVTAPATSAPVAEPSTASASPAAASRDSGDDLGPLALAGGAMLITAVVTGVVILLRRRRAAS